MQYQSLKFDKASNVSSEFPNTRKQEKNSPFCLVLSYVLSCLDDNLDKTLAFVFDPRSSFIVSQISSYGLSALINSVSQA